MKKFGIEEKQLIVNTAPRIEIERVTFEPFCFGTDVRPMPGSYYATPEGAAAVEGDEDVEGVVARFVMRDVGPGAVFEQKYVWFDDFAQLFRPADDPDDSIDYLCDAGDTLIFTPVADAENRFTVEVPMMLRAADYENDSPVLPEGDISWQFNGLHVANQFSAEVIRTVLGTIEKGLVGTDVEREGIRYELFEGIEDDNPDEA